MLDISSGENGRQETPLTELEKVTLLISEENADGLRNFLLSMSDDKPRLLVIYQYLQLLPNYWLKSILQKPMIQDIWFILFMKENPGEVLAAFEYDYFSRYVPKRRTDPGSVTAEMTIDILLGVSFARSAGPDEGVHGREFFAEMSENENQPPIQNMSRKWFDLSGGDCILDVYALRPPVSRPLEWTVFHVKMRRIAFWLLYKIAQNHGNEIIPDLLDYSAMIKRKTFWRGKYYSLGDLPIHLAGHHLQDDFIVSSVYDFFSPVDNPLTKYFSGDEGESWQFFLFKCIVRVDLEIPYPIESTLLSNFTPESVPFMYDSTREEDQKVFYSLIVAQTQNQ